MYLSKNSACVKLESRISILHGPGFAIKPSVSVHLVLRAKSTHLKLDNCFNKLPTIYNARTGYTLLVRTATGSTFQETALIRKYDI